MYQDKKKQVKNHQEKHLKTGVFFFIFLLRTGTFFYNNRVERQPKFWQRF